MKHLQYRNAGVLLAGVMSVGAVQAQAVKGQEAATSDAPISAITDWSSRSVIYGKPMLPDEFERAGRIAEMQKRYRDPRYVASVLRRVESELPSNALRSTVPKGMATAVTDRRRGHGNPGDAESEVHRDWSNILGNDTSGLGSPGTFPAKYRFDILGTVNASSCTQDFVVYTTAAAGVTAVANANFERSTGTMSGAGNPTGSITIGTGPRSVTLTASGTPGTNPLLFLNTGGDAAEALQLASAVNHWSAQTGVRAVYVATQSTLTFERVGNGNASAIAITNGLTNFAVTNPLDGAGTSGQATIVAFNQLYNTTCNPTRTNTNAPNVMWAYNTGAAITETSPVLSYEDARQVAFVQRVATANPDVLQLVLLKWQSGPGNGTVVAPVTPNSVTPANYRTCTAPCMTVFTLAGTSNTNDAPTFSSPYVDYVTDTLWVGDGNGQLHKFTGVFNGTPSQVAGSGFPAKVAADGAKLSPPVFDETYVWVGSSSLAGANDDSGRMHRVQNSNGAIVESSKFAANNTSGVIALPILDWSRNRLYTTTFSVPFVQGAANSPTAITICNPTGDQAGGFCRAVAQFNTSTFVAGSAPTLAYVGRGTINSTVRKLWNGAFDEDFYTTGTGFLYVCGGSVTRTRHTQLWRIPMTMSGANSVMGAAVAGTQIGTHDDPDNLGQTPNYDCSPVTVIESATQSRLYASIPGSGNSYGSAPGCGSNAANSDAVGQCLYMFDLNDLNGSGAGTITTWATTNTPSAALLVPGGTSGIQLDNVSGTTGASQIYFSQTGFGAGGSEVAPTLPGNAVQASQAGLN